MFSIVYSKGRQSLRLGDRVHFISHRGNIDGPNPDKENSIDYLNAAIAKGYEVEADIWYIDGKWMLGHDESTYLADELVYSFTAGASVWWHCKNLKALEQFGKDADIWRNYKPHYFWHQTDDFTLTSFGYIWTYPGQPLMERSICVMPETVMLKPEHFEKTKVAGICSDYINDYRKVLQS